MGQYYKICRLASKKKNYPNKKKVVEYLLSYDYGNGAKLMEFSWKGNEFVGALENLINKENGAWAGSPVIVAGDYADEEPYTLNGEKYNIYGLACEFGTKLVNIEPKHYRYLINEDKKLFFDIEKCKTNKDGWSVHPLTLLLADGNGRGMGDYRSKNSRRVGTWKRNVVVTSDNRPDENEYKEIFIDWLEEW